MAALPQPAIEVCVGAIKTFGRFGPAYEVLGYVGLSERGDHLVKIRVLQSGELADYELDAMSHDPEAA